jgi:hypothetical protein
MFLFRNILILYGDGLLPPRPTPNMEDHLLSLVRGCLFNIFAATFHSWMPSLHPQPEHAKCCGDREPSNMVMIMTMDAQCNVLPPLGS